MDIETERVLIETAPACRQEVDAEAIGHGDVR
jgi:hypothetical protein